MFDLNRRQKKSLGKFFWDLARMMFFIIMIGNAVANIPTIRTVIVAVLAVVFAVLGFVVEWNLDDDDPS